jgi:acyl-CoA oxidase
MKAYTHPGTTSCLQECRRLLVEKVIENRIDALKNDTEIYTTFEGNAMIMHGC